MKKISRLFDHLEDKIRGFLSHYPIVYAVIGGVGIVSFWRGVWETSDMIGITPLASLVGGLILMMAVGILVTEFLGNRIILSGLKGEKKLEEKTIKEIEEEEKFTDELKRKLDGIEDLLKKKGNSL